MGDQERQNESPKKEDFQERRHFPRIKKAIIVRYSIKDLPQAGVDMSQTKDISEKGISFTVSNPIALKTNLKINLKLPTIEETVDLEGEVIACKEIRKNIIYAISVKFINLTEGQKTLLRKFVNLFFEK